VAAPAEAPAPNAVLNVLGTVNANPPYEPMQVLTAASTFAFHSIPTYAMAGENRNYGLAEGVAFAE
jgi:hypothetical protein